MKGFTLLEILVSMVLLGIIMAAVYGAYTSSVSAIQQTRSESETWQTARVVIDLIRRDLESSILTKGAGMESRDRRINGRPADDISCDTLTHLVMDESEPRTDLCRVRYFLEEAGEQGYLKLIRSEQIIVAEGALSTGRNQEVTDIVAGLEIDFQDGAGSSSEEWTAHGVLPSLIQIRLRLGDRQGREHEFMTAVHPGITGF